MTNSAHCVIFSYVDNMLDEALPQDDTLMVICAVLTIMAVVFTSVTTHIGCSCMGRVFISWTTNTQSG